MAPTLGSGVRGAVNAASIEQAIREAGLEELSPRALEQFDAYLKLLLKWNSKVNLTAIREPEGIIRRHFVECIQCAQLLPQLPAESTLLDFGSGAGFPGIPIAICRPAIRVTLAESQRKKASFLREAVRILAFDAEVYDGRVEDMTAQKRFDVVTLRAVDKMVEASKVSLSWLKPGGYVVLFTTDLGEPTFQAGLLGIAWKISVRIAGLEHGRILIGQTQRN